MGSNSAKTSLLEPEEVNDIMKLVGAGKFGGQKDYSVEEENAALRSFVADAKKHNEELQDALQTLGQEVLRLHTEGQAAASAVNSEVATPAVTSGVLYSADSSTVEPYGNSSSSSTELSDAKATSAAASADRNSTL